MATRRLLVVVSVLFSLLPSPDSHSQTLSLTTSDADTSRAYFSAKGYPIAYATAAAASLSVLTKQGLPILRARNIVDAQFRPRVELHRRLQAQALQAGFQPDEADTLAQAALERASISRALSAPEVMQQYIVAGNGMTELASRHSLSFHDLWPSPKNISRIILGSAVAYKLMGQIGLRKDAPLSAREMQEVALDAKALMNKNRGMAFEEATTRALHAQKELPFVKGGMTSFLQIAGGALIAQAIVESFRFHKPLGEILDETINKETIPSLMFGYSEQGTFKYLYRRLLRGGLPTPYLRTAQVLLPLSAAFLVVDGAFHRRGEIQEVLQRHPETFVDPSLYPDLVRAVLHDQEYDLGFGVALFGSMLVPAAKIEEGAAVTAKTASARGLGPLISRVQQHPALSTAVVALAYTGWTAGRPAWEKHVYEERKTQASNYWAEARKEDHPKDSFWMKIQRGAGKFFDRATGFTVDGRSVSFDQQQYALQKFFENRDATYDYWFGKMREVNATFAQSVKEQEDEIERVTVQSDCYRGMKMALSGAPKQEVSRFLMTHSSHPVLMAGFVGGKISVEDRQDADCVNRLMRSDWADTLTRKNLETQMITRELSSDYALANFMLRPSGPTRWANSVQTVTQNSIRALSSLFSEEMGLLQEAPQSSLNSASGGMIQKRLEHLQTVHGRIQSALYGTR